MQRVGISYEDQPAEYRSSLVAAHLKGMKDLETEFASSARVKNYSGQKALSFMAGAAFVSAVLMLGYDATERRLSDFSEYVLSVFRLPYPIEVIPYMQSIDD